MSRKHKMLMSFAILILISMCFMIVFGDKGLIDMNLLIQGRNDIQKKNEKLILDILALCRSIERLKHDARFVESIAREELGLVRPNEYILKIKKAQKE